MKKIIKLFCILFLITITFIGCASKEINSKQVAKEFGMTLYTVGEEKVSAFKNMVKEGQKFDLSRVDTTKTGGIVPLPEEYIEIMESIDKNIKPLMTEKGYESIVANRFNTLNAQVCAEGNYTLEVTDFILNENLYNDELEDKAAYYYEANLKFISNDGKDEQTDNAKGYIGLLKENGKWKINAYDLETLPKFYKEILTNEL